MQKFKVLSETGIVLDGPDNGIIPQGSVIELDWDLEQTKALMDSGAIGVVVDEDFLKENPELEKAGVEPGSVGVVDPTFIPPVQPEVTELKKTYRGQLVIEESERTVGTQTFKHIRTVDGSEHDLTDEEYASQVK